jgi:putative protease
VPDKVKTTRLELLAPAGGFEALRAAVRNGADAVYLGLDDFNARRSAENFTLETLPDACAYAHLRDSRVYLTANVVVLEHEMTDALAMVARAWESGVDAVIVQDLGLMTAIADAMPEVRLHGSTQIDVHNSASVEALCALGVSRVTLARELSVPEVAGLVATSGVELESFVHGSLCFCHSGQCFMSSLIGGRSANRGQCAQPCRLPYDLVGPDGVLADVPGRYLLSPRDLCGIALLPALLDSGVSALKIEGRMKSPEYVAAVVATYRGAIDRLLVDPAGFAVRPAETSTLEEVFNRGFTTGYLEDVRDDWMMSYLRPNNRGVQVGRVVSTRAGQATVSLDRSLEAGDTIEFWTSTGRFAQPAGEMHLVEGKTLAAPAGVKVTLIVEKPLRPGDRVFRVQNASLVEAARRSWQSTEELRPVPLRLRVRLRVGEPAMIEATSRGTTVHADGPPVEPGRTKYVTVDEVVGHVGRLGGTPYSLSGVAVQADANAGIAFSVLHRLRRDVIELLDRERLRPWSSRTHLETPAPPRVQKMARRSGVPTLVVAVSARAAAEAAARAGADRVLLAAPVSGSVPEGIGALLPRIVHEADMEACLTLARGATPPAVSGNLGALVAAARAGVPVEADWGLNVVNPWAAAALARLGASLVWASPELSARQLESLVADSPVPVGVVVGGRLELMIAEHCVLQASGPCDHVCAGCARRRQRWALRDRKGYEMPVTTDADGRAHIYNAVPLDLARALPEIEVSGVSAVRLELQSSSPDEVADVTAAWRERLDLTSQGRLHPDTAIFEPSTSGHYFRGLH